MSFVLKAFKENIVQNTKHRNDHQKVPWQKQIK